VFRRLSFAATGEGEVSLGFAPTREAPRSSGVGPAYLVQPVTTLRPLLEQELALELRRLSFASTGEGGGVTGVCSNQRSTTLSWRGPGVSGSTRDYLASPPRAGASARAPSTFLCFDWRRGGVAKFLFEPERHLAQLALARLTLIRPATTLCPLLEKELALELPRLSFAATEGGK